MPNVYPHRHLVCRMQIVHGNLCINPHLSSPEAVCTTHAAVYIFTAAALGEQPTHSDLMAIHPSIHPNLLVQSSPVQSVPVHIPSSCLVCVSVYAARRSHPAGSQSLIHCLGTCPRQDVSRPVLRYPRRGYVPPAPSTSFLTSTLPPRIPAGPLPAVACPCA